MENNDNKTRVGFYIEKSLLDRCDAFLQAANTRSRNEFVRKAIRWFIGYLSAEIAVEILPLPISPAVSGSAIKREPHSSAAVQVGGGNKYDDECGCRRYGVG